jgi:hypothetical protein
MSRVDAMTTNLQGEAVRNEHRKRGKMQFLIQGDILLVEDGNAAQLAAVPFRLVFVKLGVHGLEERSHERQFEGWPNQGALEIKVSHCIRCESATPSRNIGASYHVPVALQQTRTGSYLRWS